MVVKGDGLLQIGERAVVVISAEFESAAEQAGFSGVAAAEDAIDDGRAGGILAVADESGAIEVIEGRIGGFLLLERGQQGDGLFEFSEGVVATG